MLRFRRPPAAPALLAAAALLAAGCSSDTATLGGTVRYQGQPVTGGSVILYCADKQIVRGLIDADGRFTIPNVPRGTAAVTVQAHARVPAGLKISQKLPPSVNGPVPPSVAADATGKLTGIPARYSHPEESGLSVTVDRDNFGYEINLTP